MKTVPKEDEIPHQEEKGRKISMAKGTVNDVPQERSRNDGKIAGADATMDGMVDLEITEEEEPTSRNPQTTRREARMREGVTVASSNNQGEGEVGEIEGDEGKRGSNINPIMEEGEKDQALGLSVTTARCKYLQTQTGSSDENVGEGMIENSLTRAESKGDNDGNTEPRARIHNDKGRKSTKIEDNAHVDDKDQEEGGEETGEATIISSETGDGRV